MPDLPSLRPTEVRRALESAGFRLLRQSGSHMILAHPDGRRAVVPSHAREMKRRLLLRIIKDAGLSQDEFIAWLRDR